MQWPINGPFPDREGRLKDTIMNQTFAEELHDLVAKHIPLGLAPEEAALTMTQAAASALDHLQWKTSIIAGAHDHLTRAVKLLS